MRQLTLALCTVGLFSPYSQAQTPPTTAQAVGEYHQPGSAYWLGYLNSKAPSTQAASATDQAQFLTPDSAKNSIIASDYVDSLGFLPAPPTAHALLFKRDEALYQATKVLRNGPRGALARADADLKSPQAVQAFACTLGVNISASSTPHLNALLRRSLNDSALSTFSAKNYYQRPRPFQHYREASCTPESDARMKADAYPSGHAAIGWTWGLILSQIAPAKTSALLSRAQAYGESRLICGVHWASDVEMGKLVGAAAFARLQSVPQFQAQLALAAQEVQQAPARPQAECDAEQAALKLRPPQE